MDLRRLSDQILLANTKILVQREREVLMDVLHHLREIERRRLFADPKQPSLFAYCTNVLKYSNAQADRRIKAMRMIKELPQIEEKISSGELSLTNVAKAKEFFSQETLSPQEKLKVLEGLKNKSTREAEKILLAQASSPAPEVRRRVSINVKGQIWQKAESKCENCQSNFALEIDHRVPVSLGGGSSIDNLRLLCRQCNQRAAITKLGAKTMEKYLT